MSALVTPNGGWKYEQNKVIVIAHTFDELVSNVFYHRQSNGIEIGNIQQDIVKQLKEKDPKFVIQLKPVAIIHGH